MSQLYVSCGKTGMALINLLLKIEKQYFNNVNPLLNTTTITLRISHFSFNVLYTMTINTKN